MERVWITKERRSTKNHEREIGQLENTARHNGNRVN
jgi:hypothetical protein